MNRRTERTVGGGLNNGQFDNGLDGWTTELLGGGGNPGAISGDANGRALLLENGSFLVTLRQTFAMPDNARELSFEVFVDPGFDLTDPFIPDAFEVQLLDDQMQSVVPTWDQFATSFFNVQEDVAENPAGAVNLAPGVTIEPIDGGGFPAFRVHLDLTGVPAGTIVTLFNDLIGADSDTASGVRVDNFILNTQPPVCVPGGPYFAQCGAATSAVQLDGTASFDPDGNVLAFQWSTDCGGAWFDYPTSATPILTLPGGIERCNVTLAVSDGTFPPALETAILSRGQDNVLPTIRCPGAVTVAATSFRGVPVSDVELRAEAADNCSGVALSDNRPAEFYPLGETVVAFRARDAVGLESTCSCSVTVVAPSIPFIECAGPIGLGGCNEGRVTADIAALARPSVVGEEPLLVTNDFPGEVGEGRFDVVFTVVDRDGDSAQCVTTVTINCDQEAQDQPVNPDRFQESLTTTTTDIGVLACGSCGAVGMVPMVLTMAGIAMMKRRYRN